MLPFEEDRLVDLRVTDLLADDFDDPEEDDLERVTVFVRVLRELFDTEDFRFLDVERVTERLVVLDSPRAFEEVTLFDKTDETTLLLP